MARKKRIRRRPAPKSDRFFQRQLPGEESPSFATIETLFRLAGELLARQPWNVLAEDQLVLVEPEDSQELCFCSVMGVLGEVLSVHVYVGAEGYHLFRRLDAGEPMSAGRFYATQRAVSVEFVRPGELTAPDRKLLTAMGHPLKTGTHAPIFRSIRPGYLPWYITESEARILAECLRAVITMCDHVQTDPGIHYWDKKDVYPLLSRHDGQAKAYDYQIRLVSPPAPAIPMPKAPALDKARIQRISEGGLPIKGVLEVDQFHSATPIGKKNERKACMRVTMAVEAGSAYAYPPEASAPEDSTGDILMRVLLKAIETGRALPIEVHVVCREFKILLDPLGKALGFPVKIAESLPALEFAKTHLLEMMGDSGPLPGR